MISAAAEPKEPESPRSDYFVRSGCLWHRAVRVTKKGPVEVHDRLCNFVARIQEEQLLDDGTNPAERRFVVAGQHQDGTPLDRVTIPAGDFTGMGWVASQWGARPIILAGRDKKDHTRAAIQELSRRIARRTVYRHTGWRWPTNSRTRCSASTISSPPAAGGTTTF